MGFGIYHFG